MNPLIRPWRHLFDFSGRATRTEYLLFHIGFIVVFLVVELSFFAAVGTVVGPQGAHPDPDPMSPLGIAILSVFSILLGLFMLAFLIGHISVAIRRLHDHNEPGIKYLLTFIPLVGIIFWLMLVFTRSDDFENDYGHDPRHPEPLDRERLGGVFS